MKKKRILVLTSTFPRWKNDATPPFVYELENRLTKDFEIHILAPHYFGAKREEVMDGLHVYRFQYFWPETLQKLCYEGGILPSLKYNNFLYIQAITLVIFELVSAIKLCRKYNIDLIHAHWIIPHGINAYIINKLFKIPYIVTCHGGDIYGLAGKPFTWFKKIIIKNTKIITVVSTAIKKEIENKLTKDVSIEVIPMGVDSGLFNPNKRDDRIKQKYNINGPFLLFVGRLAEKKGIEYLITAIPKIIDRFPKTKLLIIGSGTKDVSLIKLTKELRLTNNIIFLGALNNSELPKYYATADFFIGPSINSKGGDTEGLGLTFVEASFSGCLPIGTNVGGISDVIQDGKTGILIKEKDPKAISNAILRLLSNKSLKNKIRVAARAKNLQKFEWNVVYKKFGKIL